MKDAELNISICMGSSCYSRGNRLNLELIQSFLEEHNRNGSIQLKGELCNNQCSVGPVITINGRTYTSVESDAVRELLKLNLKEPVNG